MRLACFYDVLNKKTIYINPEFVVSISEGDEDTCYITVQGNGRWYQVRGTAFKVGEMLRDLSNGTGG